VIGPQKCHFKKKRQSVRSDGEYLQKKKRSKYSKSEEHDETACIPTQKEGAAVHLPMVHDSSHERTHDVTIDAALALSEDSVASQSTSVTSMSSLCGVGWLGFTQESISDEFVGDDAESLCTGPGICEVCMGVRVSEPSTSNPFKFPENTVKAYDTSVRNPVTVPLIV
jgi:hypothetical protein